MNVRSVRVGATLGGKYALRRELGRGGMGAVFAAENTWTGRAVAVKTLHAECAAEPELVARFWQEARAASRLRHPNVVDVLDVALDAETGEPFLVQELLDGEGFRAMLERAPGRRLAPAEALRVLLPVMDALDACHEAGVVHRDVKPSNILLVRGVDGAVVPKLIDFGVARPLDRAARVQTGAGVLLGSPHYMAPEQARGERDVDRRADVWAVAITLYEALAGAAPYEGPNPHAIVAQVLCGAPPPLREVAPDVPEDLAAAVDRALAYDRRARTPTMRAFLDDLLRTATCRSPEFREVRSEYEAAGGRAAWEPPPLWKSSRADARGHRSEFPPPVEVPPTVERPGPHTDAPSRSCAPRGAARRRALTLALIPLGVAALAFVCAQAWRRDAGRPLASRPASALARVVDLPPLPTRVQPVLTEDPRPLVAPPSPAPVASSGVVRTRTAARHARRHPRSPHSLGAIVRRHGAARGGDPLAPDETPYEEIHRRSRGR